MQFPICFVLRPPYDLPKPFKEAFCKDNRYVEDALDVSCELTYFPNNEFSPFKCSVINHKDEADFPVSSKDYMAIYTLYQIDPVLAETYARSLVLSRRN